jgi:ribosome-associated protein
VEILEEKKGEDILLLDIQNVSSFADYFVICTGTSDRMLNALANAILEQAKGIIGHKVNPEGNPSSGWLVLDLGDIIVHLFSPEQRKYYKLEQLWETGKVLLRLT